MKRRDLLNVTTVGLLGATVSRAAGAGRQPRPTSVVKVLGEHGLGPAFAQWQGTVLEVTLPPGTETAAHQHPGPTFGYVVSGRINWAIDGNPAQVLGPGMSFFEPLGAVHSTAANPSHTEPARLAVVIIGKQGEPLSRPVKPAI